MPLAGAWYEIFPRSEGATYDEAEHKWTSGTFRTAAKRLPAIAGMGFDVVYLTPIHPIGQSANRRVRNNTLNAGPDDPARPMRSAPRRRGDALHPDLGDWDDFDFFVAEAAKVTKARRSRWTSPPGLAGPPLGAEPPGSSPPAPDGTIAYAENPPKKYQDIYR